MRLLGSTLILLLAAACTAVPAPGQGLATGSPAVTAAPAATPSPTPAPIVTAAPAQPTRPPTGTPPLATVPPTPPWVVGEVPQDLIDLVTAEAAALSGVSVFDVRVVRAEQVVWNDGSLGCPQPDVAYTQALVDGYWVVLEAGGETYDFRLGSAGGPLLCPAGRGRPPLASPGLDD